MKKIIAIVGSPKTLEESVTVELINNFYKALKEKNTELIIEVISLSEKNILPCKGCRACTKTGNCIINDELLAVKKAMHEADILILGSPVHFNHVSSFFQCFVERLLVDLHTFEYIGKPFINFVTTDGSGEEEAEKYLTKIGLLLGAIKIGSIVKLDNDKFNINNFNKLVIETNKILNGEKNIKPGLMNSLYFYSMKNIIKNNSNYFKYEEKIWKERDWFNKTYKQIYSNK